MPLQWYYRTTDQIRKSLVECCENSEDFVSIAHNLGIQRLTAYSIVRMNLNSTPSQGTHSERSCWRRIASIQWRESVRRVRSCQLLPHALCWTHKYLQLVSCCKLSLFFRIQFFRWLLDFFRNAYNQISAVCIRARSF